MTKMNSAEMLPHKYPFLFMDRILEIEEGKRVVCLKNITINEDFFTGHFLNNPSVPDVVLIEAMAQTSGILLSTDTTKPKPAFLAGIRDAKFMKPVSVGDRLKITSTLAQGFAPLYSFNVQISAGDDIVAEAEIILSDTG